MELKTNMNMNLQDREWREFFLTDIFTEIQRGKRLKKGDHIEGSTPYVSSTGDRNGIDQFIGNVNTVRSFECCLTVANSGSVGETFFHPYAFIASDHVTKLKNPTFSEYTYKFIGTLVKRLKKNYGFNREMSDKRIAREKILLPVDSHGKPDYAFMEAYIKQIELEQLNEYDKFVSRTPVKS